MSDIPQGGLSRGAKLAGVPISVLGRATVGLGKRLLGQDRDEVNADLQRRTAEQIFEVLGTLKGGAMKFGQALSVFEAAMPEDWAEPYREALTKLQNQAPAMEPATVRRLMSEQLGTAWPSYFREFDDQAVAAASIGQVHRAVWRDGREVAVKLQYPGAAAALVADMNQLSRIARLMSPLAPGVAMKPLLAELRARIMEEVDYAAEANNQRAFAKAFDGHPTIRVPRVVASAPALLVSEWVDGAGMAGIISGGSREQRDRAGHLLTELHFSAPTLAHLLHADPHPGNYLVDADGRLVVIDFGSVAQMPDGSPEIIGRAARLALGGSSSALLELLRAEGFVPEGYDPDPELLVDYLVPYAEPLGVEEFHFTRSWMQQQANRLSDFRSAEMKMARQLNLPPSYLMIQRVTLGSLGILCQLDAHVPFRAIVEEWQAGFLDS